VTKLLFSLTLFFVSETCLAQKTITQSNKGFQTSNEGDLFGKKYAFIENVGQYESALSKQTDMGTIRYAYEGLDVPVFVTQKGLVFFHRAFIKSKKKYEESEEEEEEEELHAGVRKSIDRVITMKWKGANPAVEITTEDETIWYFTYGMLQKHARGFKKLVYHNLYHLLF
jgi:hypothetical protein